jgi:hypothetical protein
LICCCTEAARHDRFAACAGRPLERVLFALAGMVALLGALLVVAFSSWFWC